MKKFLSLMLVFTLMCPCLFAYALAETRASNYFSSYGTSMSAPGGGGINITFKAVGTDICNQIGVATYTVQRRDDDGSSPACSPARPAATWPPTPSGGTSRALPAKPTGSR